MTAPNPTSNLGTWVGQYGGLCLDEWEVDRLNDAMSRVQVLIGQDEKFTYSQIMQLIRMHGFNPTFIVSYSKGGRCNDATVIKGLWLDQLFSRHTKLLSDILDLFLKDGMDVKAVLPNGRNAWNSIRFDNIDDDSDALRLTTAFGEVVKAGLRPQESDAAWFDRTLIASCNTRGKRTGQTVGMTFFIIMGMRYAFEDGVLEHFLIQNGALDRFESAVASGNPSLSQSCKDIPAQIKVWWHKPSFPPSATPP
jgi:hypothetical protein